MDKEKIHKKYRDLADDLTRDAADVGVEALNKLIKMQNAKNKKLSPLVCISSLIAFNIISAARFIEDFHADNLDEKAEVQFRVAGMVLETLAEQFPEIVQEIVTVEGGVRSFEMPAEKGVH